MANKNNKPKTPSQRAVNLTDPKLLIRFNEYIDHLITFDMIREADDLRQALQIYLVQDTGLVKSHPDYHQQYEKILSLAQFLVSLFLDDKQFINLVETHLADALAKEDLAVMIKDKFDGKIVTIFEDRDNFKRELREAMLRNNQRLSNTNIKINNESVEPTVANWIKDYNSTVGAEIASQIDRINYLTNSANIKNLSQEEKRKVETLINLYEHLKKSSETVEGLEEAVPYYVNNQHFVLTGGKLEIIKEDPVLTSVLTGKPLREVEDVLAEDKEEKKTETTQETAEQDKMKEEILLAYRGDSRQHSVILKEEKKISDKFGSDIASLRAEFYRAVQAKNLNRTIALLRLLTQEDELTKFLVEDKKLNTFLAATWQKQYGPELAEEFKKNPTDISFVRLFLQYILQQRLGLPSGDAARFGLQIGNIFVSLGKKEYNKMAYFDVKSKSFKWFE
ncbi:MAG: hypothetical protein A3J62_00115 [Candidatus Buchananbacteria bacterium RIFCSPHIGHO2_02_FULL_38_8]|uniref:Uncharacterized protein n=1 Tax=Candidatus Buchananbacteria bacterium RIFCSPHIGHO2_02_FULL_38_8 TaxID=1797538 RepID=A0A1G1Y686_9BACT|nr:MAG: hypothetical protein A3J62_00115 [Candidatus Buchananbacteria bacterium RIFCSPHIGHO2_02_FULL_38_8]